MLKRCLRPFMLSFACISCFPARLISQVTQDVDVLLWCSPPRTVASHNWLDLAPLPALLVIACLGGLVAGTLSRQHFQRMAPFWNQPY